MNSHKQFAPAAERNSGPILEALSAVLPDTGAMLEVNSGTGQHAVAFAAALPKWTWQPTETDPAALASIRAYAGEADLPNLKPPVELDVTWNDWPIAQADAIFSANMIHIAPWDACVGLFNGAGGILPHGGTLLIYGPFFFTGHPPVPSNAAFDRSLRGSNPSWGVRETGAIDLLAAENNLRRTQTIAMPANNHILVYSPSA